MTISRRNLLRLGAAGAAGTALRLPWLESTAKACSDVSCRRFVLLTLGHSIMPERGQYGWIPSSAGAFPATLPRLLQPLDAFRDRMAIVAGIDNIIPRLVSSNGHNASSRTLLTCLPHGEALNPDGSLIARGMDCSTSSAGGGPSLEYVMGGALDEVPLILRASARNGEHRRTFRPDGTDDEGEPDPRLAFERLFGSDEPVDTRSDAERLAARRASILAAVRGNYDAAARRVGAADRVRLESHSSLIGELASELDRVVTVTCDDPSLSVASGFPGEPVDGAGRADDALVPTHNSLIATALGCNATRIAHLHYSTMQGNQFPFLNGGSDMFPTENWHSCVHHDSGTDEERYLAMGWYFDMVADLLRKLEAIEEPDGNALDSTIVCVTSSLGNSAHSTGNLPFLLFGGRHSGLRTGATIDYRSSESRTTGDMWTTMLNLMGVPATSFGFDDGDVDGRPFHTGILGELMA